MKPLLRNPVFHSLLYNDKHLGFGTATAKAFHEAVSPFAGFEEGNENGFGELNELLPAGRTILFASPQKINTPPGWILKAAIEGLQFLYEGGLLPTDYSCEPVLLQQQHVEEMQQLATLTKPGPFAKRTIEFGHYYGVFDGGRLAAMTGQRLHIHNFTEVSAVCTHPQYLGRGYATALVQYQLNLIVKNGQQPFLHVRANNHRAVALYQRLHFKVQGPMNFYFLKKQG